MAEPQIQYAQANDGTKIAFWEMGRGPPLVHGWFSFSHIALEYRMPDVRAWYDNLARNHRLIRYDPRGFGLSDRSPTSFDAWLSDLEAVVNHLGLSRFDLLGLQHDALIAAGYAARHPERVSGLILWQAYARAPDWASTPQIRAIRAMIDQDWTTYTEAMANVAYGWREMGRARQFAAFARASVRPDALLGMMGELNTWDMSEVMPLIRAGTLVIQRSEAPPVSVNSAREVSSLIPGASMVLLPGELPMPFQEDSGLALRTIEEFLAQEAASPPGVKTGAAKLTKRETEVLRLLAQGRTNKQIAAEMVVSVNTVFRHVANIYDKIEVANRAEATAYVHRHGIALPDPATLGESTPGSASSHRN